MTSTVVLVPHGGCRAISIDAAPIVAEKGQILAARIVGAKLLALIQITPIRATTTTANLDSMPLLADRMITLVLVHLHPLFARTF